MPTVTTTLGGANFAHDMAEMRTWLDPDLFEPARFTYGNTGNFSSFRSSFKKISTRKPLRAALVNRLKEMSRLGAGMTR